MTGPAEARLDPAAEIGARPGASRRPPPDRGRAGHASASSTSCAAVSRRGGRPRGRSRGRSRSPDRPSALWRNTASRSAWRSMPARRAASARLRPSSAWAIACIRAAARPPFSRRAARRTPSADSSPPISSAAPMTTPASPHPRIPASPHPRIPASRKNRITQRSPIEPPESGHGLAGISGGPWECPGVDDDHHPIMRGSHVARPGARNSSARATAWMAMKGSTPR